MLIGSHVQTYIRTVCGLQALHWGHKNGRWLITLIEVNAFNMLMVLPSAMILSWLFVDVSTEMLSCLIYQMHISADISKSIASTLKVID